MPIEWRVAGPKSALAQRRILRLVLGTTLSLAISQAGGWPLSFISPVLTMTVLSLPVPRPSARFFLVVIAALLVSVYGAFLFLPMLIHQRAAGLLLLSLALFHTFYFTARGGAAVVGTLLTIGLTLTVAVGSVSVDGLIAVGYGVSFGGLVGVIIAWFSHVLLPDPAEAIAHPAPQVPDPQTQVVPPGVALRNALRSLCIVLPVTVWFLLSPSSAANVAVMIKVAAMGQEAATGQARNAARSLLLSTLYGGVAAVLAWQALCIWPSLLMYSLLIALAALVFGAKIFEGRGLRADGDTWSYALLTMIVVLAPAALDSQFGSAADVRFYDRLLMFVGAALYGVGAVYVFNAIWGTAGNSASDQADTA